MLHRRQFILGTFAVALAPYVAFAQDAEDPGKFVADFAQHGIVDILAANISTAEKAQRFRAMFKRDFDIPAIGRFVLGRFARGVAPADQTAFDTLFEDDVGLAAAEDPLEEVTEVATDRLDRVAE